MSRIEFAVADPTAKLTRMIRAQIGSMIARLLASTGRAAADVTEVALAGNTGMHHLFCGLDPSPLASLPFEAHEGGVQTVRLDAADWPLAPEVPVRFLGCLGGFVGSDILAGVLATRLHESGRPVALIDLGTNGEIVVGRRGRLLCASTAAGPAFEGARISCGMRAATGAIHAVSLEHGALTCQVLGGGPPRGICGSGLVDAIAAGLDTGQILPSGRLKTQRGLALSGGLVLTQADVRALQLAKGAIAAGIRILTHRLDLDLEGVETVYLAGAFGNYVNRVSARRIGLLPFAPEKVVPAGNTALLGAKLALFAEREPERSFLDVRSQVRHVSLHEDIRFQEVFGEEMAFPAA